MNEINYKLIGLHIKKYRNKLNLTQVELGNMIGKTESSIRKYEKGLISIPTYVLEKLSEIFNISVYDLISNNQIQNIENEINYKKIGFLIKKNREKLNITQKELSEKIGKAEITVRKYEKGLVQIPNDVLEKISKVFNISIFDLIKNNNLKTNENTLYFEEIEISPKDYNEYLKFKEISEIVLNIKKLSKYDKFEIEQCLKKAYLLSKEKIQKN